MLLEKLSLLNYKNFDSSNFEFDAKINCFVGANGIGKTNILDAVYHLALEVALESKTARKTCLVLEEMYDAVVFPTPQLTEQLAVAGRNVIQIHMLRGALWSQVLQTKE